MNSGARLIINLLATVGGLVAAAALQPRSRPQR